MGYKSYRFRMNDGSEEARKLLAEAKAHFKEGMAILEEVCKMIDEGEDGQEASYRRDMRGRFMGRGMGRRDDMDEPPMRGRYEY